MSSSIVYSKMWIVESPNVEVVVWLGCCKREWSFSVFVIEKANVCVSVKALAGV
jgi:hypothetical protein